MTNRHASRSALKVEGLWSSMNSVDNKQSAPFHVHSPVTASQPSLHSGVRFAHVHEREASARPPSRMALGNLLTQ